MHDDVSAGNFARLRRTLKFCFRNELFHFCSGVFRLQAPQGEITTKAAFLLRLSFQKHVKIML